MCLNCVIFYPHSRGKNHGPHVAVLCEYDALPEIGQLNRRGWSSGRTRHYFKSAFEKAGKPLGKARIEILLRCGQGARDKLLPPTMKWTGPTLFK